MYQLNYHLQDHNIICNNIHGFSKKNPVKRNLSCITIQGTASRLRTGKDQVDVIFLDVSKAFDKVTHVRLLKQLYGVSGNALGWVRPFLSLIKQKVLFDFG